MLTIQDLEIGHQFHAKHHSRYKEPRVLMFVGCHEVGGAFLVKTTDGQTSTWLNANAPIVLIEGHHDA